MRDEIESYRGYSAAAAREGAFAQLIERESAGIPAHYLCFGIYVVHSDGEEVYEVTH